MQAAVAHTSAAMPHIDPEHVIWNEVDGNIIVLHFDSGNYYVLNGVASKIWKLLAEQKTMEEMIAALQANYFVSPKTLEQDIKAFLANSKDRGIICD